MGTGDDLPNSDWVGEHHWCAPLYYHQAIERSARMRVLVTGGAGLHRLARRRSPAARPGIAPRIFDVRPSEHHATHELDAVLGDLLDREALQTAMHGCDAVVHLAAAADVDDVARRPAEAEAVNARGTLNVLEAARGAGVAPRRLREHDLGLRQRHRHRRRGPRRRAARPPLHRHQARGEMYCRSYATLYGLDCTVLRFGIPYGPRARPAGVIPIFVRKALSGEPLTIAGEGLQSRRFVYVEDLAEGVVRGLGPRPSVASTTSWGTRASPCAGSPTWSETSSAGRDRPHPARAATSPAPRCRAPAPAAELGWRPPPRSSRGCGATSTGTARRRGARDRRGAPAPAAGVAPAAPAAPDAPARVAGALGG